MIQVHKLRGSLVCWVYAIDEHNDIFHNKATGVWPVVSVAGGVSALGVDTVPILARAALHQIQKLRGARAD